MRLSEEHTLLENEKWSSMKLLLALATASLLVIGSNSACSSNVPDVPLDATEIGSVDQSIYDLLYVYSYSNSFSCSGMAIGVNYCYQFFDSNDFIGSDIIFTAIVLQAMSPGSTTYRVVNSIPVPTPRREESICISDSCCDSYDFTNEQFELPAGTFTYGILIPGSGYNLYGYGSSQTNLSRTGYTPTDQRQNVDVDSTLILDSSSEVQLRTMSFRIRLDPGQPTPGTPNNSTVTTDSSQRTLHAVSLLLSVCTPLFLTLLWTL